MKILNPFQNTPFTNLIKNVVFVGGVCALIGVWYLCWVWLAALTEGLLVPWDTTPMRPALGTWERTVNDFFENPPGAYLPATLFVLANVLLFTSQLKRGAPTTGLPLMFALTNVVFLLVSTLLTIAAHQLPELWLHQPRPVFDAGYHQTWPAIVVMIGLVTLLFVLQSKVLSQPNSKVAHTGD